MRRSPLFLAALILLSGCSNTAASHKPQPTPKATTSGLVYAVPTATQGGKPRATAIPGATIKAPASLKTATPAAPVHFSAAAYTAVVYGTVSDRKTHKPIAGALVTVADGQKQTHTDSSGKYRVAFPTGAAASLQVRKAGYQCGLAMGIFKRGQVVKNDWKCDKITPGHPIPPPFPSVIGKPVPKSPPGGPPSSPTT